MRGAPTAEGRGTAPEARLEASLRRLGVSDAEREPADVAGKPDFFWRHLLPRQLAVFVDGCAWHGCPIHFRPHPDPTHGLSAANVARQRERDKTLRRALAASGVRVLAFWEHALKGQSGADRAAREIAEAVRRG